MVVQSTFSDLHRLHSWYASLIDFAVTVASVAVVSIAIKSKMPDKNFMSYEKIVAVVALPRFYVLNNTYICLHKYVSIYLHTNFYACCIFIFTQYLYSATRYKAQYIDLTIIKMTVLHNSKNIKITSAPLRVYMYEYNSITSWNFIIEISLRVFFKAIAAERVLMRFLVKINCQFRKFGTRNSKKSILGINIYIYIVFFIIHLEK